MKDSAELTGQEIAIVGMAARLPGARDISEYWKNLANGVNSIVRLDEEKLLLAGEAPHLLNRTDYVPYAAPLDGFEMFDADFFGLSPKEAAIMDPQHRQFLEVAWHALENAGHIPEHTDGPIGVFAGCGMGSYFYFNICSNPNLVDEVGMFLLRHTGNDKDFLSTRFSHIFDLTGPSVNVQTACSTSLVATHYACQSLLMGECDVALAGGVTIELPHNRGYIYKEGEVLSPDGECHAFDHRAQGTVFGSGAGVVVLRRLQDAIDDGDHIWAVIKGTAINNDGAAKAGYLAPSVDGQTDAIRDALDISGIDAASVDYIECHGTGTYLGDPIEVAALSQAYAIPAGSQHKLRIGSVKTNIGHLDTAAGVASLIKTSLALKHNKMPPSLGYEKPNPAIDFENSSVVVNDQLRNWVTGTGTRRAGVNSLGVGGTNAHCILEEAPASSVQFDPSDWPFQLLCLSGRSTSALDANATAIANHLDKNSNEPLEDIAWTLHKGRRAFDTRRVLVAETHQEAAKQLRDNDPRRVFTHTKVTDTPEYVFMFPGGGAQYANMARDLYETEPVFKDWMDQGLDILQRKTDLDIRAIWLPDSDEEAANEQLKTPSVQLPLIMILEYALAQLWQSWGIQPTALVGHSMGENTAACLAGVMSFEDCIGLVHLRGQLFDSIPTGGMLSVHLPAQDLEPYLGDDLDLAAINAPDLSVASGPDSALSILKKRLDDEGIFSQRIAINIAAHSQMLDPILDQFRSYLNAIQLHPPSIPLASNLTGEILTAVQATDPNYWVGHLRNAVRFVDSIGAVCENDNRIFIEVGPGKTLASLAGQHPDLTPNRIITSLRHQDDTVKDDTYFLAMLGRIWCVGGTFDWDQVWGDAKRKRVPLPGYVFQHKPYFIEATKETQKETRNWLMRSEDVTKWGFRKHWKPQYADTLENTGHFKPKQTWLIFDDADSITKSLIDRLHQDDQNVCVIRSGDRYQKINDHSFVLSPERGRDGYDALVRDLVKADMLPDRIVHSWLATKSEIFRPGSSFFNRNMEYGFYSFMYLAQALAAEDVTKPMHICALTTGAVQVFDETLPYPEKATLLGPLSVIPREFSHITCGWLDVEVGVMKNDKDLTGIDMVYDEIWSNPSSYQAAMRAHKRFDARYSADGFMSETTSPDIKHNGTYLITGGFGGIGLSIAERLCRDFAANVVLVSRREVPDRKRWNDPNLGPEIQKTISKLRRLEKAGGRVWPVCADVTNLDDMQNAIRVVEQDVGQINGVIHAAGTIDDAPILTKTSLETETVMSPKIHGLRVLETCFEDGKLDWLALFSSSSTVTAPIGQIDYVAANEYLNAYAQSRKGDKTRVLAINWGIWSGVGMAADALGARGSHTGIVKPLDGLALIGSETADINKNRVLRAAFTTKDWIIDEHRLKDGTALLPGTGYLELIAQAMQAQNENGPYEIRDLYFLRPLIVVDQTTAFANVTLARNSVGYAVFIGDDTGHFAEAEIAILPLDTPQQVDIEQLENRCATTEIAKPGGYIVSAQEGHLNFGPRWHVLQKTSLGQGEGIAHLRLANEFIPDLGDGFVLHPALMDLATGWAMGLIEGYSGQTLWVPSYYRSIKVHKKLPAEVVSWVRHTPQAGQDMAEFDITIATPSGDICIEISGFAVRRLPKNFTFGGASHTANRPQKSASAAEERLLHNLSQGITVDHGTEAFMSALGSAHVSVIVSSMDLHGLIAQMDQEANQSQHDSHGFERPELDTDFVEPHTAVEKRLADIWQDLLGIEQVGVQDSFFDLGGHSLIAVRLFAQLKKLYDVDLPISTLFEAPTIEKVAALIGDQSETEETGVEPAKSSTAQFRRYDYLVPMHAGEGGTKTPFFLVAGMFGNVMNLRQLAHLVGQDRPFYGLQARGLFGEQEPHTSLVDAAIDYLKEIKTIQSEGPYLLGGFSGGGITAFEMAQQLRQEDQETGALILLDTPLPYFEDLSVKDRALIQWQNAKQGGLKYPVDWVTRRIKWEIEKRRHVPDEIDESSFNNHDIEAAFRESIATYQMAHWDGPLTLFRPPLGGQWQVSDGRLVNADRNYVLNDNGWSEWATNLKIHEVPGDHDSMVLEPNVRVLAAKIRNVLETLEQGHTDGFIKEAAQ